MNDTDATDGSVADATDGAAGADHRRPVHVDDEATLDDLLVSHDRVLVEFYTEGCSMCAAMEPVLGNVARATDVTVALCNPRNDPALIDRFGIRSVPTLVRFDDGEEVDRLAEGFVGAEEVVSFVERDE